MTGLLLSFIFMRFFHEIQGHAPPPPELTVNPPVITETDSVTLNCVTPPYISVFRCHINTVTGVAIETSSCRRTLTGTELLKISHQTSPSKVQVICYYTGQANSPYSDTSYINIQSSVHEIQGQALLPPKLTANPPVITETDSVTLSCVTPSSRSVTRCYFFTETQHISEGHCVQTLRLSELLKMVQSLPADIEMKCFYSVMSGDSSPHSDPSTISIKTLPPPKMTVNPPVITETDSVTLDCVTPSSLSVTHCFFYTVNIVAIESSSSSCRQTLTGTELLKISHQNSPSDVQVKCFYSVQLGYENFQSRFSDTSSITIQSLKPEMSLQSLERDGIFFICSLPGSVKRGTKCNLYFGEVNRPIRTTTTKEKSSKTKQWFCSFTVLTNDLLRHHNSVQQKDASCDYKLEHEQNTLSPRSDRRSLTASLPANLSPTNTVTSAVKTMMNPTRGGNDAGLKPEMTLQPFERDYVFFICSLPGSVKRGTRCNLYFGEVNRPILNTTTKQKSSKTKQWFCRFNVTVDDLLKHLDSVQHKDASCDYKLERKQNSLSTRSDRRNLTDIVGRESSSMNKNSTFTVTAGSLPANLSPPNTVTFAAKTTVNPTRRGNDADVSGRESSVMSTNSAFSVTTGSTVIMSDVSTPATSVNPTPEENVGLKLFLPVGFGASVAVVFLVLVLHRRLKRRTATISRSGRSSSKTNANITDDSVSLRNINHGGVQLPDNNTYSLITSVPRADCSTGFEKLNREEPQSQDSDIYHLYDTIPEQPTASDRPDMLYSLLQAH